MSKGVKLTKEELKHFEESWDFLMERLHDGSVWHHMFEDIENCKWVSVDLLPDHNTIEILDGYESYGGVEIDKQKFKRLLEIFKSGSRVF